MEPLTSPRHANEGRSESPVGEGHSGLFDPSFSVDQAAEILGTSPTTVRRLLLSQKIAHQRVSERRTVIRQSALKAYLEAVTVDTR
jgi:excisionase family DNA binding protein